MRQRFRRPWEGCKCDAVEASPLTADGHHIPLTQEEGQAPVSAGDAGQDVGDEGQRHGRGRYCSLKSTEGLSGGSLTSRYTTQQ